MNLTSILITLVLLLGGGLWYEFRKRKSAEALNDNIETKEKIDEAQKDIIKNEALIEASKQKQDEIQKKLDEEKNKDVSKDDLLDFFNKSNK